MDKDKQEPRQTFDPNKIKLKESGSADDSVGPVKVKSDNEASAEEQKPEMTSTPPSGDDKQGNQAVPPEQSGEGGTEATDSPASGDDPRQQAVPAWQQALRTRGFEDVNDLFNKFDELQNKASKIPDLDDFGQRLLDSYVEGSDKFQEMVERIALDPGKLSDKEVIRRSIKSEYPSASPEQVEFLLNKELGNMGFSDDAEEEDLRDAKMQLQIKADGIRQRMKNEIDNFKSEGLSDEERYQYYLGKVQPYFEKQREQSQQQEIQALSTSDAWKSLHETKKLKFTYEAGNGEKRDINYEVSNPTDIAGMVVDLGQLAKAMINPDGTPNYNLALKIAAYAADPQGFERNLIQAGKHFGTDQTLDTVSNSELPQRKDTSDEKTTPKSKEEEVASFLKAALLAKQGKNR